MPSALRAAFRASSAWARSVSAAVGDCHQRRLQMGGQLGVVVGDLLRGCDGVRCTPASAGSSTSATSSTASSRAIRLVAADLACLSSVVAARYSPRDSSALATASRGSCSPIAVETALSAYRAVAVAGVVVKAQGGLQQVDPLARAVGEVAGGRPRRPRPRHATGSRPPRSRRVSRCLSWVSARRAGTTCNPDRRSR